MNKNLNSMVDKLIDIADEADELPDEMVGVINDLADGLHGGAGWRSFFYKNGKFSKTATFHTVTWVITLGWFSLSMFATGEPMLVAGLTLPALQPLDPALAGTVLGLASGTYVGNNLVKTKA